MQRIEGVTPPAGKHLKCLKRVFDRLAGSYYSFASGFEIDPILVRGKFCVMVLLAPIVADHFPEHMIEGSSQIVNSIAHYEGEPIRDVLSVFELDRCLSSLRIFSDNQTIGVAFDKEIELGFKITDVMVGPLDL